MINPSILKARRQGLSLYTALSAEHRALIFKIYQEMQDSLNAEAPAATEALPESKALTEEIEE